MSTQPHRLSRYTVITLLLIVALNAFGGGYYGMAGAKDVPHEWLEGSPFSSYFVPALILFTVVGGSSLISAIMVFRRHRVSRQAAIAAGCIMLGWIAVQISMIGYVSWLQPAIAIAGLLIIALASLSDDGLGAAKA